MKNKNSLEIIVTVLCSVTLFLSCNQPDDKYTRGIGEYPGRPSEDFGPILKPDHDKYRNIALLRPAYHSSSYDYNLTAQLITDGIITNTIPAYFAFITNEGMVAKNEREWVLDHVTGSSKRISGNNIRMDLSNGGDQKIHEINQVNVNGEMIYENKKPGGWNFVILGSDDGIKWTILKSDKGYGFPGKAKPDPFTDMIKNAKKDKEGKPIDPFSDFFGPFDPGEPKPEFNFQFGEQMPTRIVNHVFKMDESVAYRKYRIEFNTENASFWNIGDIDFFNNNNPVEMSTSGKFASAWMSAGTGEEWVYVDLGSDSDFDLVRLHWINKAAEGEIQVSTDALEWKEVAKLPGSSQKVDEIRLNKKTSGRYVRVLMKKPESGDGYILSELEVMGTGGLIPVPKPAPLYKDNRLSLSAGNWKIQRSSQVNAKGEAISSTDFKNENWIPATVPGTVLMSYKNAGALPDPNFGDNQLMISESFFNTDFWYRNEFDVPAELNRDHVFLNFDGINWKSEVFVNGRRVGRIEGAFIQTRFDVSGLLKPGQKNALAVLIIKNDHPGAIKEKTLLNPDKNGGILGADNPTYHASIGWDWIPTIRGRNIGIWNDVYLNASGPVTIENTFVNPDLPLPDTTSADISIGITLRNRNKEAIRGTVEGKYGSIAFNEKVTLEPLESKTITLDKNNHPELQISNPSLWWPKGYGAPNLYNVHLKFVTKNGKVSDEVSFKSGIREMTFNEDSQILNIYINGRRFIARGGNWGFPESNLAYRNREYDIAVAYHADMNFTMIRNWVAQTSDDEFFEACDRHGILIWQDFCLANPADGPDPYDPGMFLKNAKNVIMRIRNHPSLGIYVGRNEGNPPEVIDSALRSMVSRLHPGIHYISNSASGVVSGGGPYRALKPTDYFLLYGRNRLHSERGMPNAMNYESLQQMLPEKALWPQNNLWGMHDYTLEGAQSCASFNEMLEKAFGAPKDAKEFSELAQWINYDGYRSMFEGRSRYRQGLLLWMSHPAWPSMVWQTYDYYFDPTAAYFACKKASEPLHIQWNRIYDDVEVVNLNGKDKKGLKAKAQIFNMDGTLKWSDDKVIDSREDATDKVFKLKYPSGLSKVHFIKLTLYEGDVLVSENFYWRGLKEGDFRTLRDLAGVEVEEYTRIERSNDEWILTTTLKNNGKLPALMIRLKVNGKESSERILPAFFSDNYVSLMPGEEKTMTIRVRIEDTRGEKPEVVIQGFNLL